MGDTPLYIPTESKLRPERRQVGVVICQNDIANTGVKILIGQVPLVFETRDRETRAYREHEEMDTDYGESACRRRRWWTPLPFIPLTNQHMTSHTSFFSGIRREP